MSKWCIKTTNPHKQIQKCPKWLDRKKRFQRVGAYGLFILILLGAHSRGLGRFCRRYRYDDFKMPKNQNVSDRECDVLKKSPCESMLNKHDCTYPFMFQQQETIFQITHWNAYKWVYCCNGIVSNWTSSCSCRVSRPPSGETNSSNAGVLPTEI